MVDGDMIVGEEEPRNWELGFGGLVEKLMVGAHWRLMTTETFRDSVLSFHRLKQSFYEAMKPKISFGLTSIVGVIQQLLYKT